MNTSSRFSKWLKQYIWVWELLPVLISFFAAFIGGLLLLNGSVFSNLVNTIVLTSVDVARSTMIAALLMSAGAGAIGAFFGRRKLSALIGAGFAFWLGYVSVFVQQQLQPQRDEAGLLQTLNQDVLTHTAFIMLALGLLAAFIGAAVGVALSIVFLDPLFMLLKLLWTRLPQEQRAYFPFTKFEAGSLPLPRAIKTRQPIIRGATSLLGVLGISVLLFLASGSSDLFLFAPDAGIHSAHVGYSRIAGVPYNGTIIRTSFSSPTLGGIQKPIVIYLPPTYNTPVGREKHYPVLYLLHGSPGSSIDWVRGGHAPDKADELINLNQTPELIMVFPDGQVPIGSSEWGNDINHKEPIEDYITNDVVPYVDQHYRTIPNAANRAIGGNSMGGFGGANIAIHHPSMFGFVISLGGYYEAEGKPWGKSATYHLQNSPSYTLPRSKAAKKIKMFIGAATKDQPYYSRSKDFVKLLQALHMNYHFDVQLGRHAWKVWETQVYDALLWIHWGQTDQAAGTSMPDTNQLGTPTPTVSPTTTTP